MPSDIKIRLTDELGRLKMDGDDFNRYYLQFQAYYQHIQTTDESMLVMIFLRGLEGTLQHAVQLARPATLMAAYEAAWKAHLGPSVCYVRWHEPVLEYLERCPAWRYLFEVHVCRDTHCVPGEAYCHGVRDLLGLPDLVDLV